VFCTLACGIGEQRDRAAAIIENRVSSAVILLLVDQSSCIRARE
jgi:hypothetical protein